MRARTFARRRMIDAAAGWSHPYKVGPFSPLYADGGDAGAKAEDDGKPDTGTESAEQTADDSNADTTDWKAEAEKYKALMRKHEARAKENANAAKERDELRKQSMSEQERAVDEATAKARAEERVRLAGKLARQGFIAAAAGRLPNAASVADDLNLAKYVGEDGEIDESGLAELVERLAPPKPDKKAEAETEAKPKNGRGFDQGPRGSGARDKATTVATGRDLYASRKKTTSI
ncbi:hypothetical protein [Streptomyces sp. NPDC101166]|uniref:hypothetical protein n=1 Tax=Streptomyces sp. NPDC101166 TaxID=3366120 RepID=UPI003802FB83